MNRSNNILIVDKNIDLYINGISHLYGGATIQTFSWLNGFKSNGYNPIICSENNLKSTKEFKFLNFSQSQPLVLLLRFFFAIIKYRPKFIYCSTPSWKHILILIPAKIFSSPIVQRISNDNLVDKRVSKKMSFLKLKIYNYYLKKISVIACQNSYQFNTLKLKFPNKNIIKIYNPYIINDIDLRENNRNYVAWIGIFQYQKNLSCLYDIARSLPQINFKIAGEPYKVIDEETKNALVSLKELDNIKFVGLLSKEEIRIFLKSSYCLLNTSHYEGFSNTFLEAFETNTPVVTTKKTDPDDLISSNNFGIVVESFDQLGNALIRLINSKFEINSKDFLLNNFEPKTISKKLINLLK